MRYTAENSITISAAFAVAALEKVAIEDAKIDKLLQSCRIPKHLLKEPDARISLNQYSQLLTQLMRATNDEFLGHADVPLPVGTLALLLHWITPTKTIRHALQRYVKFYEIVNVGIRNRLQEDEDSFHLYIEQHDPSTGLLKPVRPYIAEFAFFGIHRILCWLRMENIPIQQICFQFEKPIYARDYRLMYYGAPVAFNEEFATIQFNKELLDQPVNQSISKVNTFLQDPNTNMLTQSFSYQSWATTVATTIRTQLDNLPTLPQLAEQLNVKPYTLQRRLANEGVTYLDIKNQLKRDAAIDFLVNTDLSIEAISLKLGFSEISPFTRTFKSWTGLPPSAYRKYQ